MEPGPGFMQGPKDAGFQNIMRKADDPGPGTYELPGMKTHTFSAINAGLVDPPVRNDRLSKLEDNGVPGPGTHEVKDLTPVQNFLIKSPEPHTAQYKSWKSKTIVHAPVGP